MRFCPKCEKKLDRDIENSTDNAICSNCNISTKEELDKKAITEWDELFGEYLVGMYGKTTNNLNEKILYYKSLNLEKNLFDEGHSINIIQEILAINSSVWITAFENKPIDIRNFSQIRTSQNKNEFDKEIKLKYEIFMNAVNNLKKDIIQRKLLHTSKSIPFSTFVQWVNCKNKKKYFDLRKITRLLNYHKYEIIFVKSNNIVAEHRERKNSIFLNLINSTQSSYWDISLHILGKILMNLGKPTTNKSRDNTEFVEEAGAITKYGWHAYNNEKSRRNALKKRLYVEGFIKTIGTHKHIRQYWRSPNSPNHEYLPALDEDIIWLQTYPIQHENSRNRLSNKYTKLQKNNEQLKNKKPSLMFFVNVSE